MAHGGPVYYGFIHIGAALIVIAIMVLAVMSEGFRHFLLWVAGIGVALIILFIAMARYDVMRPTSTGATTPPAMAPSRSSLAIPQRDDGVTIMSKAASK